MASWWSKAFGAMFRTRPQLPSIPVDALGPYTSPSYRYHDGDKWAGGFGATQLLAADYWTLRARSSQLFETNLYARGLIRRLITNEINVGLHLEATPEEAILGVPEKSLDAWSEDVENRFSLWERDPWLCHHSEASTFGALQEAIRLESLVAGDVLIVLRQYQPTGLPRVQLINGASVQSPMSQRAIRAGNRVKHGVELDAQDRQVAYWVRQPDGTSKRLPAFGEKSGRRLAWLVYGTDKRIDDVRGKPILALVLQSLNEIDRYRDSTQRKAVINSMLAMFVKKTQDKMGTSPLSGGAIRRGTDTTIDSAGTPRDFAAAEQIPGLVIQELQVGEEPQAFGAQGTDERFGAFEEAIIATVAWANEYPPEIMRLAFSSNYSASQAAINELKMYLNRVRTRFSESVCQPIYIEWLIAATLAQKLTAPGLLESWRDSAQYDTFGAWTASDWAGQIKPAVDLNKLITGYEKALDAGLITRQRAARELFGLRYSKIIKQLATENQMLADAREPLLDAEADAKREAVQTEPVDIDKEDDEDETEKPKGLLHVAS